MTNKQKEREFLTLCMLTGVCDYLYDKGNRPPRWSTDTKERESWWLGYNETKKACAQ